MIATAPEAVSSRAFELLLVGGGLQNALIALSVLDRRPNASLALLEASEQVGGNHTWSFHAGDVPEQAANGAVEVGTGSHGERGEVRTVGCSRVRLRSGKSC